MNGYCCLPGIVIHSVRIDLAPCLVFCLLLIFILKLLGLKIYFHSPFRAWPSAFFTLELNVKAKAKKLIVHMNLYKAFNFQHGLKLKLFFLKLKAQVMKLMLYDI